MKTFLTKLAVLLMLIVAVLTGWAAFAMSFAATIFNLLLGVVSIFFFTQALDLIDKLNKLGSYGPESEKPMRGPRHHDEEDTPEESEVE